MRFNTGKPPTFGETRIVWIFLLIPLHLENESGVWSRRWLEFAKVKERYLQDHWGCHYWKPVQFVD